MNKLPLILQLHEQTMDLTKKYILNKINVLL